MRVGKVIYVFFCVDPLMGLETHMRIEQLCIARIVPELNARVERSAILRNNLLKHIEKGVSFRVRPNLPSYN